MEGQVMLKATVYKLTALILGVVALVVTIIFSIVISPILFAVLRLTK